MEENKLPVVARITEGAIIHFTVQVNLDELCWLVTDDTSFTSPMVTIFTCIPKCFIIVCFAGVSNTVLPECKQLIYSDVPSWNTSLFVWTVDILILFQCFSCFHCHLCHCSHVPAPTTVITIEIIIIIIVVSIIPAAIRHITIATINIINRNSSKLNQCLHGLNYLHLHIQVHLWLYCMYDN